MSAQVEYKVIILDPSPLEANECLNAMAEKGWRVVGVYGDDRVILARPNVSAYATEAPKAKQP